MNCWIQDGKSETHFYAYVRGGGLLLSVGFEGALLYFLAPSDDSSSFCRLRWAILPLQASSMTLQMHLYGVQLLLPVVRDWSPHKWIARGSFARPLRLSSLLWFRKRVFSRRALATAAVGASPNGVILWPLTSYFGRRWATCLGSRQEGRTGLAK